MSGDLLDEAEDDLKMEEDKLRRASPLWQGQDAPSPVKDGAVQGPMPREPHRER